MFWSNNGKGNTIEIKNVVGILDKDYEPTEYQIIILTPSGKITWSYFSKSIRDEDIKELKKLREEYRNKK